jgi:hypothetical protein
VKAFERLIDMVAHLGRKSFRPGVKLMSNRTGTVFQIVVFKSVTKRDF